MRISAADYIGQLLVRHLSKVDTGNIGRFSVGPHSRRCVVLSAIVTLPHRELDVLVKFNRLNMTQTKLTVSGGWVDPVVRQAAKYFFSEVAQPSCLQFIRDFYSTTGVPELSWVVGKHLITQYFGYNLYAWRVFQRISTQRDMLFSTHLPGLNDDSDIRISHDNMLNVVTTNPRRKNLEDAIKNEIASVMRQEGIQLLPEEETNVEFEGAETPQIQAPSKE